MQTRSAIPALALAAAIAAPAQAALTFNTFVSGPSIAAVEGQNATIGFAYAGDKFVGSVYNTGPNNNQLYKTDLNGGNVQLFGSPITGFSGEIYLSASLGIGGYGPRDVFAGAESQGTIYRVAHDGSSQGVFATGLVGGVRSIAFDPYGLYGNKMLVATNAGNVYTVSNTGVASLLASVGEDAEGLSFAPQSFGSYVTGTLFVASEGSGTLRAITPGGTISTAVTGLAGAEMVSFVPLNLGTSGSPVEGFYAAAYPNDIQKAGASQFTAYRGDAVITSETGHQVWQVHFNAGTGLFEVTQIGTFPAQPEDGIFVTADIIQNPVPEPETYALMLAGLGALGWFSRRRKQAAAH
ncbi:MAG: PEP-CTERM sorting domain-containing protein [Pseudomonadota bacterium]|nr:PEP-CTERM sorting domain-containing protein [Pseudomonadota bacterium]